MLLNVILKHDYLSFIPVQPKSLNRSHLSTINCTFIESFIKTECNHGLLKAVSDDLSSSLSVFFQIYLSRQYKMMVDWDDCTRQPPGLDHFYWLEHLHKLWCTFFQEFIFFSCGLKTLLFFLDITMLTYILLLTLKRKTVEHNNKVKFLVVFYRFSAKVFTLCWYYLKMFVHWLLKTLNDLFFSLNTSKSAFLLFACSIFYLYLSIDLSRAVCKSDLSLMMLRGERLPFFKFMNISSF